MHPTHDWTTRRLAVDRAAEAQRRAATHRLRVAAGVDLHGRLVAAVGGVADRLRDADVGRRDRAAQAPVPLVRDTVRVVRPA